MVDFNRLMYRVAQDHEFLKEALKSVIRVDPFVRALWDIHCKVREEGLAQPVSLDHYRNDFMIKVTDGTKITDAGIPPSSAMELKQIELNTIASASAGIIGSACRLHRYTLDLAGKAYSPEQIPDNDPGLVVARGMVKAWELYGNKSAVILFMGIKEESNIFDQRLLEFKVHQLNRSIRVIRRTLDDCEVALVLLRDGYSPDSYPSDRLSGCKKIQQVLARSGAVEKYISDPAAVERIRATFAGQYGNNLYGVEMKARLEEIGSTPEREAYILMEKIAPLSERNYLVKQGLPIALTDVVSELGTYGVHIGCSA
nr:hypothetical protein BaRGS_007416 [Batillaria attramentaria]